jgi:hypothetical protein
VRKGKKVPDQDDPETPPSKKSRGDPEEVARLPPETTISSSSPSSPSV